MAGAEGSPGEKPVPSRTTANAAPPNEDHDYFRGSRDHPFRPDSGQFELVNAWWLAEASLLAYADPEFAIPCFEKAGFGEVEHLGDQSTQCYVARHEDFVIVAFSGTDMRHRKDTDSVSDILTDWLVNLNVATTDSEDGGKVHLGFQQALDEVWNPKDRDERDRLKPYLDEICEDGRRKVWFTGHSLGAALATLAAGRYDHAPELYTFGSPRVGDGDYADSLDFDVYRFVNGEDIVTRVPLSGPYHHVGAAKFIDEEGAIHDQEEQDGSSGLLGNLTSVVGSVGTLSKGLIRGLPTDALVDHAPIYYAVHIWNNYIRG